MHIFHIIILHARNCSDIVTHYILHINSNDFYKVKHKPTYWKRHSPIKLLGL